MTNLFKSTPHRLGIGILMFGFAGGLFLKLLGIPAGLFIGCLIFSGIFRFFLQGPIALTGHYHHAGQILFGILIGTSFHQDNVETMKLALLPMLFQIFMLVSLSFVLGMKLSKWTPIDKSTSILSSLPGGLPVMVGIAADLNHNAGIVAVIHFFRLTMIIMTMPILVPFLSTFTDHAISKSIPTHPLDHWGYIFLVLIGVMSYMVTRKIKFPGGEMLIPLLFTGSINLFFYEFGDLVVQIKEIAIICLSVSIGSKITLETIKILKQVIVPAGCIIIALVSLGLSLGILLHWLTDIDMNTALLSSVPGGAASLTAIADDLGADMRIVGPLHLFRLIVLSVLTPLLFYFFTNKGKRSEKI